MILTVTLNLALDITYHLGAIRWGQTNTVEEVAERAGGKGVNVARVLHTLGEEVAVTGLVGGGPGEAARAELAQAGIRDCSVAVAAPSRRTIMVVEPDGAATGFSEAGGPITSDEWQRFLVRYRDLIAGADAVVLSGSLPRGVPDDAYARLTRLAARKEIPVLLDAGGAALAHGVAAAPAIVKVNAEELASIEPGEDRQRAARAVAARGPEAVVVSEGPAGMLAVTRRGLWHAAPPTELVGNPTGAGDAAAAALIAGALAGTEWPDRLADAVALSAAAVCAPHAGSFDAEVYARLQDEIVAAACSA